MTINLNIHETDIDVNEVVTINEDDSYSIFLGKNLCAEKRLDAFLHAMKHIWCDDFQKDNVQEIERNAHRG